MALRQQRYLLRSFILPESCSTLSSFAYIAIRDVNIYMRQEQVSDEGLVYSGYQNTGCGTNNKNDSEA